MPRLPTRSSTRLRLWAHATSLGGVESSLERRRRWPGELKTVPEGLVRLSVGIEHVEDLWDDLAQALAEKLTTPQVISNAPAGPPATSRRRSSPAASTGPR